MTTQTVYSNGNTPATPDRSAGGPLDRQKWARSAGLTVSGIARAVLAELAYRAHADGRSWPSQYTLAQQVGFSVRSVKNAIKELAASGVLTIEVSGKGHSSSTYRLVGAATKWAPAAPQMGTSCPSVVQPVPIEPCIEPYNEPYLEPEKSDDDIPEEPEASESTATQPTLTTQPVKVSKPRKPTPKVKQEPSVSESFIAAMVERYPGLDVPTQVNAALNHKAAKNYFPDHEPYVGNWLRRSAEWAKERGGKPKSTRAQIKADWQEYDFFGEEKQTND